MRIKQKINCFIFTEGSSISMVLVGVYVCAPALCLRLLLRFALVFQVIPHLLGD